MTSLDGCLMLNKVKLETIKTGGYRCFMSSLTEMESEAMAYWWPFFFDTYVTMFSASPSHLPCLPSCEDAIEKEMEERCC